MTASHEVIWKFFQSRYHCWLVVLWPSKYPLCPACAQTSANPSQNLIINYNTASLETLDNFGVVWCKLAVMYYTLRLLIRGSEAQICISSADFCCGRSPTWWGKMVWAQDGSKPC